jgi:Mg/Co/Ni transporter MgtE
VYDYVPGKIDWLAHGLPSEGRDAGKPTAGRIARRDIATCSLDETLGGIRDRASRSGGTCVVVNEERVVLGVLCERDLAGSDDTPVADAMRPGPSTFRPNVAIAEMADYMTKHNLENAPITSADGRLVGVLFRGDAIRAANTSS